MLAYVFWHAPDPAEETDAYERRLIAFHKALAEDPSAGFSRSASFRLPAAPWLEGEPVYEDWYLVAGSEALDPLNDAAVSGARKIPHDRVAATSAAGAGGLYRLRIGSPALPREGVSSWFAKPPDWSYARLYETLGPAVDEVGRGLWGRQMVLGPASEFCFHGPPEALEAAGIEPQVVLPVERVWHGPSAEAASG